MRRACVGSVGEDISALRQLGSLGLSSNLISGVIPSGLSSITNLTQLDLVSRRASTRGAGAGRVGQGWCWQHCRASVAHGQVRGAEH